MGKLDVWGQRINIEIVLPGKGGKSSVTFMSGWMVGANGKLTLTTPYAKGGI